MAGFATSTGAAGHASAATSSELTFYLGHSMKAGQPYRSNIKDKPAFFPKALYKTRARIEQAVGKLKRFKRIALRCEKTAKNYGSFVALALGFILIKSVHTA